MLFVRVLCASAVRVGVCGVCVCLGALIIQKKNVGVLCASAVRVGACGGSVCFGALRLKKKNVCVVRYNSRPLLQDGVQGRSQERRVRLGRDQRPAPLRVPRRGSHLP